MIAMYYRILNSLKCSYNQCRIVPPHMIFLTKMEQMFLYNREIFYIRLYNKLFYHSK